MKTLIVSDIHLTNKFDKNKFIFLQKLFNSVDKVILNGDFWSLYSCSFQDFLNSEWKTLFPTLLQKNAVYIYGNHDSKEFIDDGVKQFSTRQEKSITIQNRQNKFFITHGDGHTAVKPITNSRYIQIWRALQIDNNLKYPFFRIMYRIIGNEGFKRLLQKQNLQIAEDIRLKIGKNTIIVFGHTHLAEDNIKENYLNTGFIDGGFASYLVIDNKSHRLILENY